jgi:hypothetical protein
LQVDEVKRSKANMWQRLNQIADKITDRPEEGVAMFSKTRKKSKSNKSPPLIQPTIKDAHKWLLSARNNYRKTILKKM